MRTLEMREICFKVEKELREKVKKQLEYLYGNELGIFIKGEEVCVRGDLHNYKKRNKILFILSGGKYGKNI